MKSPRPYQIECFEAIREAYRSGKRCVIAELATGLGKTVIFTLITKMVREKGGKVLIIVNRDVLVSQAIEELAVNGIYAMREQAGERATHTCDVVVGSVQSMQGKWLQKWAPNYFRMVITDECHGSRAKTFRAILDHFSDAFHLGVTATAERHDKKGLWPGYEDIVYRMPLRTWTDPETGIVTLGGQNEGWLVNFEFQELPVPIVLDDAVAHGGKVISEEAEIAEFKKDNYLHRLFHEASEAAKGYKGLAFLPGCSASEQCAEEMRKRGINARHIEGYMPRKKQLEILQWFKDTKEGILCNADLLSVGFNQKDINWLGMFRIVRSTPMYKQRLGRGTRALADVDSCADRESRLQAIANSAKPICKVIDLMIQNEDHNLATPSCLITDNEEEIQELNKARAKGSPVSMDAIDEDLGKIRIQNHDKQLEKLATDAANRAERRRNFEEPYYKHILNGYERPEWKDASAAQIRFLKDLGYKGPESIKASKAKRIIDLFLKTKNRKP